MTRFLVAVASAAAVFAAGQWLLDKPLGADAGAVVSYLLALPTFLWLIGGGPALRTYADGQPPPHAPEGWRRFFSFDVDHKTVGVQYIAAAMTLFLTGGVMALLMRLELAHHGLQFLTLPQYTTIVSLHGIEMVLVALIATAGGIGNFVVPLQLGARDMAFPRLNALSFWLLPPAVLLLAATPFFGGLDFGWAAYAPLSELGDVGKLYFLLAFITAGFSSIFGGLNFLATALTMRARGLTWGRVPIFTWGILSAAIIQVMGTSVVAASMIMVIFDRMLHTTFFDPNLGGTVLLYQHLFWYYSHPAVYIMALPGFAAVLEILPVFCRKPLFAYPLAAASFLGIVATGFFVWAHHMFTSGMWLFLKTPFMINTELISVPTGVVFLAALGTLWEAKIRFDSPMFWALAMLANFLIGGLTGIPLADAPTDLHFHETWFVVAHFHFTIMGGAVFGFFAAFHYWFPKMSGKRLNETLAKLQCGLMFVGFNCVFLPMFWLGAHGMRRRVADFPAWMDPVQLFISCAAVVIALSALGFLVNVYRSLRSGETAGDNPWEAKSLEWQAPSPPLPHRNFRTPPVAVEHPYDLGVPA